MLGAILPHTKKLTGTPFWEIRILGKDNLRVVYISQVKDEVIVLHGFIKKSQKTPDKEIDIAFKRFQNWKLNH